MTELTKAQTDILAAFLAQAGPAAAPTGAHKTIAALLKRELITASTPAEGPTLYALTEAGRGAIGAGSPETAAAPKGKIGALIDLLRQSEGTTLDAMMAATGWQAHSVRGALSGAIKKKLALAVISEKTEAGRRYLIKADA